MSAYKPRSKGPAGGDGRRQDHLCRPAVVRVAAPANDNGPAYTRAARLLVRLLLVLAGVAILVALIR
jgi:hypothetical protein